MRDNQNEVFVINIGKPESDGRFLCYGFEPAMPAEDSPGGCYRPVKEKCMMRIPLRKGRDNTIRLIVRGPVSGYIRPDEKLTQKITISVNNHQLKTATVVPDQWQEIELAIPGKLSQEESAQLQIICEQFCESGAFGGSLYLAQVKIAHLSEAGKQKETAFLEAGNVYFGDLHKHTVLSPCGKPKPFIPERYAGTVDENYQVRSEKDDFCSITDHSDTMSEEVFRETLDIADKYNKPGQFITLYSYEWTSNLFGHKNVYSTNNKDLPFLRCNSSSYDTPAKLWEALQGHQAITIPHHPNRVEFPCNWDTVNNDLQPLVEIYSGWGCSEYFGSPLAETANTRPGLDVQSALLRGHKLGFVGGSDGHLLHNKPAGHHTPNGGRRWGLTGVWAENLTRQAIFAALKRRTVYATTGEKIVLNVSMNDYPMGSEICFNQYNAEDFFPLCFAIDVIGTEEIAKIELLCNGAVIRCATSPLTDQFKAGFVIEPAKSVNRVGTNPEGGYMALDMASFVNRFSMYFYVRVTQVNGHMAWSSPIWFTFKPATD